MEIGKLFKVGFLPPTLPEQLILSVMIIIKSFVSQSYLSYWVIILSFLEGRDHIWLGFELSACNKVSNSINICILKNSGRLCYLFYLICTSERDLEVILWSTLDLFLSATPHRPISYALSSCCRSIFYQTGSLSSWTAWHRLNSTIYLMGSIQ